LSARSKNGRLALALGLIAIAVWAAYILMHVLERSP
jgi:hypothetical protein